MKKIYIRKSSVFYLWATFDLLYIIRFIWINIAQGRIPLIDDITSFAPFLSQHGWYSLTLFSFSLLLNVSIIFSAALLFIQWKSVRWLIYAQTPLRLLYALPSLSVLPWLLKSLSVKTSIIFIFALVASEVLKISTIYFPSNQRTDKLA